MGSTTHALASILAGSSAGVCVDLILFPIDTIKTRIQSSQHSVQRGPGSLRLFAGLPAILAGSAPAAAAFFVTYETTKHFARKDGLNRHISSMFAACMAEIVACIVRVPCELMKQRKQNSPSISFYSIITKTLRSEGWRGMYRGYFSMIFREVPFSFIQFPLWEELKRLTINVNHYYDCSNPDHLRAWQFALCGSLAGGLAGALTTPLDVAKTRIMLAETDSPFASGRIMSALRLIHRERGIPGLFSGVAPRVLFLSMGGAIFLGVYDMANRFWRTLLHDPSKVS